MKLVKGRMSALRAAKQTLRGEIKRRVAALSDKEKRRQSLVVSQKVTLSVSLEHVQFVSSEQALTYQTAATLTASTKTIQCFLSEEMDKSITERLSF